MTEVEQWQQVVLQQLRAHGPDHADTLAARVNLGEARGRDGDAAAAFIDIEIVLDRCRVVLGDTHRTTLVAAVSREYWNVAVTGDRASAVAALERLVPATRRHLGVDDPVALAARANLAAYRDWSDLPEAAAETYDALAADFARVHGAEHPDAVALADHAAAARVTADQHAEAAREITLMFEAEDLGLDDVDELDDDQRAAAVAEADDFTSERAELMEAIDEHLEEIAEKTERLGPEHDDVLQARRWLAIARYDAGDRTGAIAELDRLIEDVAGCYGATDARVFSFRFVRAMYRDAGRDAQLAEMRELRDDANAAVGPENSVTLVARREIARLTGSIEEAKAVHAEQIRLFGETSVEAVATGAVVSVMASGGY